MGRASRHRIVALVAVLLAVAATLPPPAEETPLADPAPDLPYAELLGPLAPIALSPFFGITCLSGLAYLEDRGTVPENQFLERTRHLRSPVFFVVFAVLSILSSLPRMTKLSKPLAQGLDLLETYSGIVTFVVLRLLSSSQGQAPPVVEAGALQIGLDGLLLLASAINILVIAVLRFFFEVLVWLSPVPLIDALFEAANKIVCAGMMVLYAYSPTLATALNLALFAVALLSFRWTLRRSRFWRSLGCDPLWQRWTRRLDLPERSEDWSLKVFARDALGPFPAKQELRLLRREGRLVLQRDAWWRRETTLVWATTPGSLRLRRGLLSSSLQHPDGSAVLLTRAYHDQLERIAREWGLALEQPATDAAELRTELA